MINHLHFILSFFYYYFEVNSRYAIFINTLIFNIFYIISYTIVLVILKTFKLYGFNVILHD